MSDNEEQLEAAAMRSEGKEIQNWADVHMFEAVPTNTGIEPVEPSVKLISMTPDPLGVIAAAAKMYEGKPVDAPDGFVPGSQLQQVSDKERLHYFEQFANTRLKAPFEFVSVLPQSPSILHGVDVG